MEDLALPVFLEDVVLPGGVDAAEDLEDPESMSGADVVLLTDWPKAEGVDGGKDVGRVVGV
jgi:hypothetical protein